MRTLLDKVVVVWGSVVLIVCALFLLFPDDFGFRCTPDYMAKYYDRHEEEFKKMISECKEHIADKTGFFIEFEHGKLSNFYIVGRKDTMNVLIENDTSDCIRDSIMNELGLNKHELQNIKKSLDRLGCISIRINPESDYSEIGFRRILMALYSYRIYDHPIDRRRIEEIDEEQSLIFYRDNVVFEYGGGAIGPLGFEEDVKSSFLEKRQSNKR